MRRREKALASTENFFTVLAWRTGTSLIGSRWEEQLLSLICFSILHCTAGFNPIFLFSGQCTFSSLTENGQPNESACEWISWAIRLGCVRPDSYASKIKAR